MSTGAEDSRNIQSFRKVIQGRWVVYRPVINVNHQAICLPGIDMEVNDTLRSKDMEDRVQKQSFEQKANEKVQRAVTT